MEQGLEPAGKTDRPPRGRCEQFLTAPQEMGQALPLQGHDDVEQAIDVDSSLAHILFKLANGVHASSLSKRCSASCASFLLFRHQKMDSYSGSLPGETPEETLVREVREELARSVRLVTKIGEAAQVFYALDEDCLTGPATDQSVS